MTTHSPSVSDIDAAIQLNPQLDVEAPASPPTLAGIISTTPTTADFSAPSVNWLRQENPTIPRACAAH